MGGRSDELSVVVNAGEYSPNPAADKDVRPGRASPLPAGDLAGELPEWLAPVQAVVLPIADRHDDAARAVRDALVAQEVRAELDDRTESVGRKIRDAELRKIPYMLVIGDREAEGGTVAVREHRRGDTGSVLVADCVGQVADTSTHRSG